MPKLSLKLESLAVESFEPVGAGKSLRGTVVGADSNEYTQLSCAPCTGVICNGGGSGAYTCGCPTVTCNDSGIIHCVNTTGTGG